MLALCREPKELPPAELSVVGEWPSLELEDLVEFASMSLRNCSLFIMMAACQPLERLAMSKQGYDASIVWIKLSTSTISWLNCGVSN